MGSDKPEQGFKHARKTPNRPRYPSCLKKFQNDLTMSDLLLASILHRPEVMTSKLQAVYDDVCLERYAWVYTVFGNSVCFKETACRRLASVLSSYHHLELLVKINENVVLFISSDKYEQIPAAEM